jgi:Common central domain of tyrosinase
MAAASDRDAFIVGCVQLANTPTGLTALEVNNTLGPQVPNWQMRGDGSVVLSWWDLFVLWHYVTMELPTQGRGANRAHGGPVFLPWHRMLLLRLEQRLQTVLGDTDFALPYWDWARDRQLGSALNRSTARPDASLIARVVARHPFWGEQRGGSAGPWLSPPGLASWVDVVSGWVQPDDSSTPARPSAQSRPD